MTTTTESQPTTDNLSTPMEEFILNRVFDKTDPSPDAETIAKRNVAWNILMTHRSDGFPRATMLRHAAALWATHPDYRWTPPTN